MTRLLGILPLLLATSSVLADEFRETIQPYLKKYCVECHTGEKARAELDLAKPSSAGDVIQQFRRWQHIIEFTRSGEMPPEDSPQPDIAETNRFVEAVRGILLTEARQHAGDPGVVPPRRLSNSEFDYAVLDLTGVDIRPTRDFPADPAGGEGFDNTGEALRMSPNLLKKYLAATQRVADHLVLKPSGIVFAPFPVTSYNERKKLTEQAVIDFYMAHAVDIGQYIEAAWRFEHRQDHAIGIEQWATDRDLSPRYLNSVWSYLNSITGDSILERELRSRWTSIPAPTDEASTPLELKALKDFIFTSRKILSPPPPELIKPNAGNWPIQHLDYRARIAASRSQFQTSALRLSSLVVSEKIPKPSGNDTTLKLVIRLDRGLTAEAPSILIRKAMFSQADHLPRNEDERKNHKTESLASFLVRTESQLIEQNSQKVVSFGSHPMGGPVDVESCVIQTPTVLEINLSAKHQSELAGRRLLLPCEIDREHSSGGSVLISAACGDGPKDQIQPEAVMLVHPASQESLQPAAEAFCRVFPDEFFHVDRDRGLAAGFHLVEGFFRDDQPLVDMVLTEAEKAQLDQLWQELDFVTESAETLLRGFVWFERAERETLHDERFDFLRAEDPELVNEPLLGRFERLYLDKMGVKRVGDTLQPEQPSDRFTMIHHFFDDIRDGLARHQRLLADAERRGLADLERLAQRAWRRPLSTSETESLRSLYRSLRDEGQSVEMALRGLLTGILMSPHFCYFAPQTDSENQVAPLTDLDMASRLSLFLWSSLPDDELLQDAGKGELHTADQMAQQAHRMRKDPRVSRLAREFLGQWLRYRDYLEKDPINAAAFTGYDEALRQAIFEEPTQLATWLIQQDRPVTELLSSEMTFVNERLAIHYGGEILKQFHQQNSRGTSEPDWLPVSGLHAAGRGGLLGMAVILTKNSSGERTSPVKRGFWCVHHLLGQHFPPPPADVPDLPKSEKDAPHSIRELLAAHVADPKCAMCHRHFDGLGLAMEGFDAIGRNRTADSAGRPIDNRADLPGGQMAQGVPELIRYVEQQRRHEFVRTLCTRFLGYALGRSVRLSDEPLLTDMEVALEKNEYRFSVLIDTVVRSPQFRLRRGQDD